MQLPRVTVIFLSYNQQKYVGEALASALKQDLAGYELVIADDASTDESWAEILSTLASEKRDSVDIKLLRQRVNRGIIGNFNDALSLATGDVLVAMAGDDVSEPQRIRRLAETFASSPNTMAVTSQSIKIDAAGIALGLASTLKSDRVFSYRKTLRKGPFAGGVVTGACAAYHRRLFDIFGPLPPDAGGEDIDYMVRALIIGDAQYLSEPLVRYRQHQSNACNFEAESLPLDKLAEREIRMVEAMSRADRQWTRDLDQGRRHGLVTDEDYRAIVRMIRKFVLRHRLSALSLRSSPMGSWWAAALPLLGMGDVIKVLKLLWLRLSPRRRRRHWEWVKARRR